MNKAEISDNLNCPTPDLACESLRKSICDSLANMQEELRKLSEKPPASP